MIAAWFAIGFALQGAKRPELFFLWISLAACWIIRKHFSSGICISRSSLFLSLSIVLAWILSLDPSASAFRQTVLLWGILLFSTWRNEPLPSVAMEKQFDRFLTGACAISVLFLIWQRFHGAIPYGWIPLNPNFTAAFIGSVFFFFLPSLLSKDSPQERAVWSLPILLLSGAGLLLGPSRSALLAWGLLSGIACWRYKRHNVLVTLLGLAAIGMIFLNSAFVQNRMGNFTEDFQIHRHELWGTALRASFDYPMHGYGAGNFETAYWHHAFPIENDAVRYARSTEFAHNEFLQLAVDQGWPVALFISLAAWLFCIRQFRQPTPRTQGKALAILFILSLALVNPILHLPWLMFLLTWSVSHFFQIPPIVKALRLRSYLLVTVVSLLWLGSAYAGARAMVLESGKPAILVRLLSGDAELQRLLGYRAPTLEESIESFRRSVAASPSNLYSREALASALELRGHPEDLQEAFELYYALTLDAPARALNMLSAGRVLYRLGDLHAARSWFEKARRTEPHYWETYWWIARCFASAGDLKRGRFLLRYLSKQHAEFERQKPFSSALSPYEMKILIFDEGLIQRALASGKSNE